MTEVRLPGTRAAGSETKRQQRTIEGYYAKTTSTETLAALHSLPQRPEGPMSAARAVDR